MSLIASLPNISAYGTPSYFIYLLIAILPLAIGLYFGKRFQCYEALLSFAFLSLMFDGASSVQGISLLIYLVYQ
ncbi:MAG: D-alanyl-lipoteichoic acid biosynthesis protein DltB, partial [Lactobacillus sp.]|nr:D-alanyl-lipoteichoic acid biosynthesis protein DltB [Lactobacillus sp.]